MPTLTTDAKTLRDAIAPLAGAAKDNVFGSRIIFGQTADPEVAEPEFRTSDYATAITTRLNDSNTGQWDGPTNILPLATDYDRLVKLIDAASGEITLNLTDQALTIKASGLTATLPVRADEFSRRPTPPNPICEVSAADLLAALHAVEGCAAKQQERFSCVAVTVAHSQAISLSATDGVAAAYRDLMTQPVLFSTDEPEAKTYLIPITQAKSISALLKGTGGSVTLGSIGNTFHIESPCLHWETTTLSAAWAHPFAIRERWEQQGLNTSIVDRGELISALRAAMIFDIKTENDRYSTTEFTASPDGILVTATGSGGQVSIEVAGQSDDAFTFKANTAHFLAAANVYRQDELLVMQSRELGGIIVAGELDGGAHLIAPIVTR